MSVKREIEIAGRPISFTFNKFAKQANGSVMVQSGGTQVLVTVCCASKDDPNADFLPLGVDYVEKAYASGRLPGGYNKREGKLSDAQTLNARVLDRPLRPCFPKGYYRDTVVTATVVSYEQGYAPVPLALMGASTALMISDIPFEGPLGLLRIGLKNDEFIIDPEESTETDLDLTVACKPDAVLMVEAGANFLSEEKILEAIEFAHKAMEPVFAMQVEIQKEIGKPKFSVPDQISGDQLVDKALDLGAELFRSAFAHPAKKDRLEALSAASKKVLATLNEDEGLSGAKVEAAVEAAKSKVMREDLLTRKVRIDGRSYETIRPIACEVGLLERTHGSSLFTRGETQALATVTLASIEEQQRTDALWDNDLKHPFMLHYNFPPFSVGEARMQRAPGRREVGHGSLARRALVPVLPSTEEFTYTIRLVSETLESNGSSSMAAVCSGTMALWNAGVPLKEPVAGIAMGLVKEGDRYAVLSDILGDEDHLGDMDFKVTGTRDKVTALQMDIKIGGISRALLGEALAQAKAGRSHILDKMLSAISAPAEELSVYAPRIFSLKVKPEKIRDIIGPGGKTIRKISSETKCKIDVDDEGLINIVAPDAQTAQAVKELIRSYTSTPKVGDVYLGKVVRLTDFGVFVELKPGVDGLCHISQFAEDHIEQVSDFAKLGDEMLVKVVDVDRQNRIKLSRKDAIGEKPII